MEEVCVIIYHRMVMVQPQKKHRFSREELSMMVVKICSDWVTMEEIEVKTGKSNSYLRNSVIKRMQNERKLGMLYPNARNHPKRNRK